MMKAKERMLNDQLQQITQLKQTLTDKEEEMKELSEAKSGYRQFYDDKLQVEIEETERQKGKVDERDRIISELEEEINEQRTYLNDREEQISQMKE